MNRPYARRGTMIILVLLLIFLAAGLMALFGASVTDFVRTHRVESDRLILRQAIDSGVAWAHLHASDWPMSDNLPQPVRLEMPATKNNAIRTEITLSPVETSGRTVLSMRIDAVLHRKQGHGATKSVTAKITPLRRPGDS